MWVSCLSSLSSASSPSKVTRLALNLDFFGGAGVRDGSWSGRSGGSTEHQACDFWTQYITDIQNLLLTVTERM